MILDEIVRDKRTAVARAKATAPVETLRRRPLYRAPRRSLRAALERRRRGVIAEIKRASPSKGIIRADVDAVAIARAYAANGAAAISVLTEEQYFHGHLDLLAAVRNAVDVAVLRKDFLFDPYQLDEARAYGADAVLLIAAIVDDATLRGLLQQAAALDLSVLVEVHDAGELERAVKAGAPLIGINNRDLRTFDVTLATTETLVPMLPAGVLAVSESGIERIEDIERLERAGVRAFLIGEALMRAADPGAKLVELLGSRAA